MSHQDRHSTREGDKSIRLDIVSSVVRAQFEEERAQIELLLSSPSKKDDKFIHNRGRLELELLPRIEELLIEVMERAVFGESPPTNALRAPKDVVDLTLRLRMGKTQFEQNFVEALGLQANPFEDDFKHIYTNIIYPTLAEKIIAVAAPKLGSSLTP